MPSSQRDLCSAFPVLLATNLSRQFLRHLQDSTRSGKSCQRGIPWTDWRRRELDSPRCSRISREIAILNLTTERQQKRLKCLRMLLELVIRQRDTITTKTHCYLTFIPCNNWTRLLKMVVDPSLTSLNSIRHKTLSLTLRCSLKSTISLREISQIPKRHHTNDYKTIVLE